MGIENGLCKMDYKATRKVIKVDIRSQTARPILGTVRVGRHVPTIAREKVVGSFGSTIERARFLIGDNPLSFDDGASVDRALSKIKDSSRQNLSAIL